ncbi:MAG: hypothetical protein KC478_07085 [Bacteriovoracaceae bacterium]|nr:hypothetical protein [Bacteriovoracaceae bacterium]
MKKLLFVSMLATSTVFSATGDPDSLKIKLYRFAVSDNADCSNPKVVVDRSSNPQYVSMLDRPEFGSGEVDNGTYPCVMIEMSDQIKFSPDGNVGTQCDGNVEYTLDVCGGSGTYQKLDGTTGTCAGDNGADSSGSYTETKVVLYLSTNSTSTGGGANAFVPPTTGSDATKGFQLGSPLIVSGTEVGIFDVDGTGKVDGDPGPSYCEFMPPLFSFSKQ